MSSNKILIVDFVNKKIMGGYVGPSNQVFTVLTPPVLTSHRRVIDSIEKIDRLIDEIEKLKGKSGETE